MGDVVGFFVGEGVRSSAATATVSTDCAAGSNGIVNVVVSLAPYSPPLTTRSPAAEVTLYDPCPQSQHIPLPPTSVMVKAYSPSGKHTLVETSFRSPSYPGDATRRELSATAAIFQLVSWGYRSNARRTTTQEGAGDGNRNCQKAVSRNWVC